VKLFIGIEDRGIIGSIEVEESEVESVLEFGEVAYGKMTDDGGLHQYGRADYVADSVDCDESYLTHYAWSCGG